MADVEAHDFGANFVVLTEGPAATPVAVGTDFWERTVGGLPPGRLVSVFETTAPWAHWEMHPAGDEVIVQLSGTVRLLLEVDGGEQAVTLAAGQFVIVPQGVWHTAEPIEAGRAVFITPGAGTAHRPR